MRPQGRAEPGIEHVGVLDQRMARAQLVAVSGPLGTDEPAAGFSPVRQATSARSARRPRSRILLLVTGVRNARSGCDAPTRAAG